MVRMVLLVRVCVQEFRVTRKVQLLRALELPEGLRVMDALDRVLRLPSVASKRYLTSKVQSRSALFMHYFTYLF